MHRDHRPSLSWAAPLGALLVAAACAGAAAQDVPVRTTPQVRVGRVAGTLRRADVASFASRSWGVINACVGRSGPRPAQVTVRFVVGASRRPEALAVRGATAAAECIRTELATWSFPPEAGLGAASVTFRTRGVDADLATLAGGLPVPVDVLRAGGGVVQAGQGVLGGTAPLDPGSDGGSVLQAPARVGQAVVGALTGQTTGTPAPAAVRHTVTVRVRSVMGGLSRAEVSRGVSGAHASLEACIDQQLPAGQRGERRVQVAIGGGRVTQRLGGQGADAIAGCVDAWLGQLTFPVRSEAAGVWLGVAFRPRAARTR